MQKLILYTTEGCHLCEQAELLLEQLPDQHAVELDLVDIANSEGLVERYGIRIPVVKKLTNDAEMGWPFDTVRLLEFLAAD